MVEDVVIADVVRSPLGRRGSRGALAPIPPAALLAQVALALLDRVRLEPAAVTRVLITGGRCGLAQEVCSLMGVSARLSAPGLPGESAQRIIHASVRETGRRDVVLVLGAAMDGGSLDSTTPDFHRRGVTAELVGARWKLERSDLDAYARQSRQRAREVAAMGEFGPETVPVVASSPDSRRVIRMDETICSTPTSIAQPLFYEQEVARRFPEVGWNLHAGNISHPADGAAAAILVGHARAVELGLRPRARVLALAECERADDAEMCGPIRATRVALKRIGIEPNEFDHYEVSESFASIPLAWQREFSADADRLNPRGGALGLGNPDAASGLRSLATALSALEATGGRLGIQTSEGAGNAGDSLVFERLPRPTLPGW